MMIVIKDLIGKTLILPFVNREIPVIADDYVDASFGTGCVKLHLLMILMTLKWANVIIWNPSLL